MPTEKEKMLASERYDAGDPELRADRRTAKAICHAFNAADPNDIKGRMGILAQILNLRGRAYLEPTFFCDYGYNIHLGNKFYANHNLVILDGCRVDIGDNVMFGPNVMISTATHPLDPVERRTVEYSLPVRIGDDVWIGGNVAILPGVTIGDRTVIGAGSVVTRDIPSDVLAVGNPCRVLRDVAAS
jgi:maltose O-acetyltransferase